MSEYFTLVVLQPMVERTVGSRRARSEDGFIPPLTLIWRIHNACNFRQNDFSPLHARIKIEHMHFDIVFDKLRFRLIMKS